MIDEIAMAAEDPQMEGVEPAESGADGLLRLKQVVMVLAAFNLGLLAAGIYMYSMREPAAQAQYVAPQYEEPQEVQAEVAEQTAGTEAAATVAPSGGLGASARVAPVGSRPAAGLYRRRGDIVDIFCQPWPDETEAEWRARVAGHCES